MYTHSLGMHACTCRHASTQAGNTCISTSMIYIYIYIRRPLQSVERVRLHLQAPKQAGSQPANKAARQQAARQQGSQDLPVDSRIPRRFRIIEFVITIFDSLCYMGPGAVRGTCGGERWNHGGHGRRHRALGSL